MLKSAAILGLAVLTLIDIHAGPASAAPAWRAELRPEGDGSVTGTANIKRLGKDSTTISISLRDATPNAVLPWHLHSGSCEKSGAVVGPSSAYPLLKVADDGTAHSTAAIPTSPPASGDYSVNVHKSAEDLTTIVACGDLVPATSDASNE